MESQIGLGGSETMGMFGTEFHLQKLTLLTRPGQLFGKKNTLPETNSHFATDPEAIMGRGPTQKETSYIILFQTIPWRKLQVRIFKTLGTFREGLVCRPRRSSLIISPREFFTMSRHRGGSSSEGKGGLGSASSQLLVPVESMFWNNGFSSRNFRWDIYVG